MTEYEKVTRALDERLFDLQFGIKNRSYVLNNLGGERIQKQKIRLVLAYALLAVLLLVGTALAVHSFHEYAQTLIQKEVPGGFDAWPAEDKLELVSQLMEAGLIDAQDERIKQLTRASATQRDALTREIVEDWLEQPIEYISFFTVMEKLWGDFTQWTPEQKAWQTEANERMGMLSNDHERYVVPGEEHISIETAVSIARRAFSLMLDLPVEEAEGYTTPASFIVFPHEVANPDYRTGTSDWPTVYTTEGVAPVWYVELYDNTNPQEPRVIAYVNIESVFGRVDYSSLIMKIHYNQYGHGTLPDSLGGKITGTYQRLSPDGDYHFFGCWPVASKAAWTTEMRTLIADVLANTPSRVDDYTKALATCAYGEPQATDITEEVAQKKAILALEQTYGIEKESLDAHAVYAYYDITDAQHPLWRFCFDQTTQMALESRMNYRVEIDPQTGETVTLERYDPDEVSGEEAILRLL